jgi:hypothetical protein
MREAGGGRINPRKKAGKGRREKRRQEAAPTS